MGYIRKFFLRWGLLIFCIGHVEAQQNVGFQRLTTSEGLSHNQVRGIAQDTTGFIWIGTSNGLQRYDGKNLITFKHDAQNPNSISHNNIRALHCDDKGGVWIGTRGGGLDYYHNGKFTHYYHQPNEPGTISDNAIECIAEDHNGNLWVGTRKGGLNKFSNGIFQAYKFDAEDPNSISHNAVFALLVDTENHIWAGTYGGGLCKLENGRFTRYIHDPDDPSTVGGNFVTSLLEAQKGKIWVGFWQGGLSILENGHFVNRSMGQHGLNSNSVLSMVKYDQKIWLGTWGGGVNYLNDNRFETYTNKADNVTSLGSDFIESLFVDNHGFLWVGTYGGGLNRFSKYNFTTFRHRPHQNSLSNNHVNDIIQTKDGTLWIGTMGGGLNRYIDGKFTVYNHIPGNTNSLNDRSNTVWSIVEGHDGGLWLGTENGLDFFKDGQFKNYQFASRDHSVRSNIVYSLTKAADGGILVGTWKGEVLKFTDNKFEMIYQNEDIKNSQANNPVSDIEEDEDGTLWIASGEGGGVYHVFGNKVNKVDLRNGMGGPDPEVYTLLKSKVTSTLWIGTIDGLYQYNTENERMKRYNEKSGLCSNGVLALAEDNHGNLWISTMGGLSKLNPNTGEFDNFNKADGLQGNQFNRNAVFFDRKLGKMYFGGTNGFNVFYPDSVNKGLSYPKVVLTKLELSYEEVHPKEGNVLEKAIESTNQIVLSHKDEVFSIEYTALGKHKLNEDSQYAYYLDGYEQKWNHVGTRTLATYSNIPPGDYIFKVKTSNENGEWSEPVRLKVQVLPPWWETWWARLIGLALIIGGVYSYFKRRLKMVEMRRKELEELVHIRTRDLEEKTEKVELQNEEIVLQTERLSQANLILEKTNMELREINQEKDGLIEVVAHDLRSPLAACVGLMDVTALSMDDTDDAKGYMDKMKSTLLRLIDMISRILDSNSLEVHSEDLKMEKVNLVSLLDEVGEEFRILAEKKQIVIENQVGRDPCFVYADATYLLQVYENLLSNAIKFSPSGQKVFINLEHDNGKVRSIVKDNGPGIDEGQQHRLFKKYQKLNAKPTGGEHSTGLGLAIVKRFVEAMEGHIWCESTFGKGAAFIVEFEEAT